MARSGLLAAVLVTGQAFGSVGDFRIQQMPLWVREDSLRDLSSDGSTTVGFIREYGPGRIAGYRIRNGSQLEFLPTPLGAAPSATNANGSVAVGTINADLGYNNARPFYWSETTGLVQPGLLQGGSYAWAQGISDDGSTMVGYGNSTNGFVAWKWSASTGYTELPRPAGFYATWVYYNGISADGSTILGYGDNQTFGSAEVPVRWSSSGVEAFPVPGTVSGMTKSGNVALLTVDSVAKAWYADGSVFEIGSYPNAITTYALCATEDGSFFAGNAVMSGNTRRAWFWTRETGLVDLQNWLTANGTAVGDVQFWSVSHLAADQTTIAGSLRRRSFDGDVFSTFTMTIPSPAASLPLLIGICFAASRRRQLSA